jgi:IMP cyclohydrolase
VNLADIADENARRIVDNPYPGRFIVVGRIAKSNTIAQVYALMGRSENSRNRRFVQIGNTVRTEAIDAAKVKDPSLIIYSAMREKNTTNFAVTNGKQTEDIFDLTPYSAPDFRLAMRRNYYEPDSPNFTPRISALYSRKHAPMLSISIVSKSVERDCVRSFYEYEAIPTKVMATHCLHFEVRRFSFRWVARRSKRCRSTSGRC